MVYNESPNAHYDQKYYEQHCGLDYNERGHWTKFFGNIADRIIEAYSPKTVLDIGCAWGYLVEALHERGVEAYGIDISEYAISKTSPELRKYFNVQSILDTLPESFPEKFDVVTNIEVIEHIAEEYCEEAIAKMCGYSDIIIFSSSASDITEPTHVNVQQPEYWAKRFAKNSFFVDAMNPVDYISRDARCYKKTDAVSAAEQYEHQYRLLRSEFDNLNGKLQNAINEINDTSAGAENHLPRIYPDFGNGYEEKNAVICRNYDAKTCYLHERIVFPEVPVRVRFDPLNGMYCMAYDITLTTENGIIDLNSATNGVDYNGKLFFSTYDSNIQFENEMKCRDFTVSAHIIPLMHSAVIKTVNELISSNEALKATLSAQRGELDRQLKISEQEKNRLKQLNLKLQNDADSYFALVNKKDEIMVGLENELALIRNRRLIRYGDKLLKIPKKIARALRGKR